jgi:hypothetical protein
VELGFHDVIRFNKSQNATQDRPGLIKLTVSSVKQKGKVYEALAKAARDKKKNIPRISVTDEMPAFLREKQGRLEAQSFEIRKADRSTKTRIFFKGIDIVLKRKLKGENVFQEINDQNQIVGTPRNQPDQAASQQNSMQNQVPKADASKAQSVKPKSHFTRKRGVAAAATAASTEGAGAKEAKKP